jgi:hypothetical protein
MTADAETSCIIHIKYDHNHEGDDRKLERQELSVVPCSALCLLSPAQHGEVEVGC